MFSLVKSVVAILVSVGGLLVAGNQPNIILLLSDDQHWNETSVQMHPDFALSKGALFDTPHLEKMAAEGMRFSSAYAPAPVCSPTRISIQTGMSPASLNWTKAGKAATANNNFKLIPPSNVQVFGERATFAEYLQSAGYVTAHFGKWHLGVEPTEHGYDVSDGNIGNEASGKYKDPNPTDIFGMTDRAVAFMKAQQKVEKPFFMQLSYLALHSPENASQKNIEKFEKLMESQSGPYVIYMSDNGANGRNNALISGSKGSLQEGGIRAVFIVKGPGVKANSWCHERVVGYDLFPTFCELAQVSKPFPNVIEGGDISHLFKGSNQPVKRSFDGVIFHFPHYQSATPESALYLGDYKLTHHYETGEDRLYNIAADLKERHDLSEKEPEIAEMMSASLRQRLVALGAGLPIVNEEHDPSKPSISTEKRGAGKGRKRGR